jgi:hypothetical protein
MSETFTVRVTVPASFLAEHDIPVIEEMIAEACANLAGTTLAANFEDDDFDATIDMSGMG